VNQKLVDNVGNIAMIAAMLLYISFIDQIRLNLSGKPGSIIMPIVSIINCLTWSFYGYFKKERDWKIIAPNIPGIFLAPLSIWTAVYCIEGCRM
jgi:uncharacterized protein with PQ loop repeat